MSVSGYVFRKRVIGELERLEKVFRVAFALFRGGIIQRLQCNHKGTYAGAAYSRGSQHRDPTFLQLQT